MSLLPKLTLSIAPIENTPIAKRALDLSWILPNLAVGAFPSRENLASLKDLKITHILNLCLTPDFPEIQDSFNYCHNPTNDLYDSQEPSWFFCSLDFGLKALQKPSQKLYIHCFAGISRSPATAYVLLRALGKTKKDSEYLLSQARPHAKKAYRLSAEEALESYL